MIDAAVHNDVPSTQALFPYLPPYWIEHVQNTMFKGPTESYYPPTSPIAARPGSRPEGTSTGDAPTGSMLWCTGARPDRVPVDVASARFTKARRDRR